jgi:hypothetical protein
VHGAVGGVAHQAVEDGPDRAEDVRGWVQGRILDFVVGGLRLGGWMMLARGDVWGW